MTEEFFRELDLKETKPLQSPTELRIVGNAALRLQGMACRHGRKIEYLEGDWENPAAARCALSKKHHYWLEGVRRESVFLPAFPLFREAGKLNAAMKNYRILALDTIDVIISKIRSFGALEAGEIEKIIGQVDIPLEDFRLRFQSAIMAWNRGRFTPEHERIAENFHAVERDFLGVEESAVTLPSRIEALKHA